MNNLPTEKALATDWERVDALTDDEIDTTDIPPLTEEFFKQAQVRLPKRLVTLTVQVDADVLEWFKAQGADYEQRISAALHIYVEAHKTAHHLSRQAA